MTRVAMVFSLVWQCIHTQIRE